MTPVLLTVPPGIAPRTKNGDWGVIMLHTSGQNEKTQWFDYRSSPYEPAVRAEWAVGTMMATVPPLAAGVLVAHGYARVMTLDEAKAFNKGLERAEPEVKLDVL